MSDATNEGLTEQQLAAVEELAQGHGIGQVAATLGINRSTIWRWQQNETFKIALRQRRDGIWSDLLSRTRSLVPAALEAAAEVLAQSDNQRLRLKAAELVLKAAGLSSVRALQAEKELSGIFGALTPDE